MVIDCDDDLVRMSVRLFRTMGRKSLKRTEDCDCDGDEDDDACLVHVVSFLYCVLWGQDGEWCTKLPDAVVISPKNMRSQFGTSNCVEGTVEWSSWTRGGRPDGVCLRSATHIAQARYGTISTGEARILIEILRGVEGSCVV